MSLYLEYGEKEIEYIRSKDKRLGGFIDRIGHIYRQADDDLFLSVVHKIVGQQISMKAQETVWARLKERFGVINADTLVSAGKESIQACGISFRKAGYIYDFACKVRSGEFDVDGLWSKPDDVVAAELSSLNGIGVWTAEMIMLFCMRRPNVFSYGDLAIHRGLRMVYRRSQITKQQFEKYRKKFSPYCSVVSLYLWAIAAGAIPELKDCLPKGGVGKKNCKA